MTHRLTFEEFYQKTIRELGYRISERQPLNYRVARCIQRIYKDERSTDVSWHDAELLAPIMQLSYNAGFTVDINYRTQSGIKETITVLKAYPDGGMTVKKILRTLPHHSMKLRSHAK
jgi:hypothetical protein